jgi:hypothetical protein
MKSTWRKHLIICVVLGLAAVPIYFLDLACASQRGTGNWITLDLSGLSFGLTSRSRYRDDIHAMQLND